MAYNEQTSIAHAADLIDRIVNFASANGWTVHRNSDTGLERTATIRKAGVSDYVHLYCTEPTTVHMAISVGYDALLPVASQPDVSYFHSLCTLEEGPYPKAFLFASGDMVWVTIAIARSGEYRHLTFGVLDKVGAYTGGTYCDGTDWGRIGWWADISFNRMPFSDNWNANSSGVLRADADGLTERFYYTRAGSEAVQPDLLVSEVSLRADYGLSACMVERADQNAFSGRSVFHAIPLYVSRLGSETYYSPVGVVRDVRYCSINKFEPEQEVSIASDVYKVFPVVGKRPMNDSMGVQPAASGDFAYAIRKVL